MGRRQRIIAASIALGCGFMAALVSTAALGLPLWIVAVATVLIVPPALIATMITQEVTDELLRELRRPNGIKMAISLASVVVLITQLYLGIAAHIIVGTFATGLILAVWLTIWRTLKKHR